MYIKMFQLILVFILFFIEFSNSSAGDHSPYYQRCLEKCEWLNCTEDGKEFKEDNQPYILRVTLWNCHHECKYECMWKTVEAFHERNWRTPQFHGKFWVHVSFMYRCLLLSHSVIYSGLRRSPFSVCAPEVRFEFGSAVPIYLWPFIRVLGMQEPASVIFSILNAYFHIKMMKKFRKEVRPNSPLIWLWNIFFIVCVHAWFWSAIFHYRDFVFTEILDYTCAFSLVLMNCYLMSIRILYEKVPKYILIGITLFFTLFLMSHVAYLSMGQIDYGYNMELNIAVGTFTALCWFAWCIYKRKRQRYVWKCAIFVASSGILLLLELVDRPPYFYIFDYHSLWHLATAPLPMLVYSFAIDDCRYLRQKKMDSDVKKKP